MAPKLAGLCLALMLAGLFLSLITLTVALPASHSLHQPPRNLVSRFSSRHNFYSHGGDYPNKFPVCDSHNISIPIDHFHNESMYEPHLNGTFQLRYWFDAQNYRDGGPVILFNIGEGSGGSGNTSCRPLHDWLLHELANATGGLLVAIEHRYYGNSIPIPYDGPASLRFLTTQQALADNAYFAQHVNFEGLNKSLTAPGTAYIAYGVSYAGGFSAFLRTQYPNLFFGAISSSGVTKAIYDYWEYYEPVREHGPPECILAHQKLVNVVDNILISRNNTRLTRTLKAAFGLEHVRSDVEFAHYISARFEGWQNQGWNGSVDMHQTSLYCKNLTSKVNSHSHSKTLTHKVKRLIEAGGYGNESAVLTTQMLNLIKYVKLYGNTSTAGYEDLQGNKDFTMYSWPYQSCTQWGYFFTGSGVPVDQLPLVSRLITLEYLTYGCREVFGIDSPPNTEIINAYGGFDIAYDRMAFIDGEADPWKAAGTHAPKATNRTSTINRPFILIEDGHHGWDVNVVEGEEPPKSVADAQRKEVGMVKAWMEEWKFLH